MWIASLIVSSFNGLDLMANRETTTISRGLVNSYIKAARTKAKSQSEKAAVTKALLLSAPASSPHLATALTLSQSQLVAYYSYGPVPKIDESKAEKDVATWQRLIFNQLHVALCTRTKKYAKEMAALQRNARLLIGAVAGYVAASVGATVAVIAALVAALLRLVLKIGLAAFCERWKSK
jgi:hypothetical protein